MAMFHGHSEFIIIGWTFMYELKILPPLSLARFHLTQQLIYKYRVKAKMKSSVLVMIFLHETSV